MTVAVEGWREVCRDELESLWHDLGTEIRFAINCTWSLGAVNRKQRIQRLTRLVGPTPWQKVPPDLLANGIYEQVHREIGVSVESGTSHAH
jgi:hypothetical protein